VDGTLTLAALIRSAETMSGFYRLGASQHDLEALKLNDPRPVLPLGVHHELRIEDQAANVSKVRL